MPFAYPSYRPLPAVRGGDAALHLLLYDIQW